MDNSQFNAEQALLGGQMVQDPDDGKQTQQKKKKVGYSVHIRQQMRTGRKSWTTIAGLAEDLNLDKILGVMRKMFSTNGTIVHDATEGDVIQLQGDHRQDTFDFLTRYNIVEKGEIKVHGA
jgi:translation initiation factor 1